MKPMILILFLAAAAGIILASVDQRLGQAVWALGGGGGMVYFAVLLGRQGPGFRGDIRESPGRMPLLGVLICAGILFKALADIASDSLVLARTLEAFAFAATIGGLALLTRPATRDGMSRERARAGEAVAPSVPPRG